MPVAGWNNAWESPGPIASLPTVKAGLRAVPAQNIHNWVAAEEENLVASMPVGVLQSHLAYTTDQNNS